MTTPEEDPGTPPEPGKAVRVAPSVIRLTAPNPGIMTGPGTNTYVVGSGERAVIDPGPLDATHLDTLTALAEGRIGWVIVTHAHPDHAPAAKMLAERSGAEVVSFGPRPGLEPDRSAGDGFVIEEDGFRLRALHTPGHSSDHLCWIAEDLGLLFSGDQVIGGSTVVIAPPDGDMSAYFGSVRRLLDLDPPVTSIAPGHGPLIQNPRDVLDYYLAHRLERERLVLDALAGAGSASVDELLPVVYSDIAPVLLPVARYSLWAHLRKLGNDGAAVSEDADELGSSWRATSRSRA